MNTHIEIPIVVAKTICDEFRKSAVVIIAFDPASEMLHFTTYGTDPQSKVVAAEMADQMAAVIGGTPRKKYHDFRHVPAAERAAENERLNAVAAAGRDLLALMDQAEIDVRLGEETDRVFSYREFAALRQALESLTR